MVLVSHCSSCWCRTLRWIPFQPKTFLFLRVLFVVVSDLQRTDNGTNFWDSTSEANLFVHTDSFQSSQNTEIVGVYMLLPRCSAVQQASLRVKSIPIWFRVDFRFGGTTWVQKCSKDSVHWRRVRILGQSSSFDSTCFPHLFDFWRVCRGVACVHAICRVCPHAQTCTRWAGSS